MKAGRELDKLVGVEVLDWHWDDDWGCLIPPHQIAKPSEMWTDWEIDEDGDLSKKPIKENWASGVSYSGGTTKIILPEWSTDDAAAMELVEELCNWDADDNMLILKGQGDKDPEEAWWTADIQGTQGHNVGKAKTRAHAISLAALKAKGIDV